MMTAARPAGERRGCAIEQRPPGGEATSSGCDAGCMLISPGTRRVVVVGADAAGMSAAHQALRTARTRGGDLAVTVLESGWDTSYSACGIPYWVAGDVASVEDLVARTAAEHRAAGIDLRLGTTAVELDLAARTVATDTGERLPFDDVVLATGAAPVVPDWAVDPAGRPVPGVRAVKTLDDGRAWIDLLAARDPAPRRAVVVGGGYIGLEMAEAFARRGLATTIVTRGELMSSLDPDFGARLRQQVERAGVAVHCQDLADGLVTGVDGVVRAVTAGGREIPADVVALGTGVRPRTGLGGAAGLPLGDAGGYLPDPRQRLADGVWAAGDCVEPVTRTHGNRVFVPLGTHAVKQGRVAGTVLAGGEATFDGVIGTAVTRFVVGDVHAEVGRTGPTAGQLAGLGVEARSLVTESTTASGYLPEAAPITVKVTAAVGPERGRLLAVQIVGGPGSAKRIDTAAAAVWFGATVADVAGMDLSYAPPFSPTWDPVQIACRRLADRL
jgi:NADPH-dependent 2,4-dienoyl-CoA reductase/sulfur reductase-like enzyme